MEFLPYPTLLFTGAGVVAGALLMFFLLHARTIRATDSEKALRQSLETELLRLRSEHKEGLVRIEQLLSENATLQATLEAERRRYQEQLALLQQARDTFSKEFENLANRIFEEKQASFRDQSKLTLDATLNPLRDEILSFRRQVEAAYNQESAERNRLVGQIQELKTQAQRIGEDAIQLARALKGDSKVQGNWGEVILERLLEQSGLKKGREYETQTSLTSADGGRRNPDVIIRLPDKRDIVVDAKVSLVDYERYCREEDDAKKQRHMARHLASLRAHISGLDRKAYEQLEGINTLDFVLIFVPLEAAFMAAVEHDATLLSDAYERGVILVSPTTLLATLRTVSNIWRYEDRNQNAQKIAAQAGSLYDQFVLVIEALEDVGRHLGRSQEAWQLTRNRLMAGRGNVVKRLEDLKNMGARARRSLPPMIRDEALLEEVNDGQPEDLEVNE